MITAVEIGSGGDRMHLRRGRFQWLWQCVDAIWSAFTGSHRTPPLSDYLLRIAPAATRASINTTIMQHVPTLLAVSVAIAMWRCYTACISQWRRFVAFIKATKRHHRASTRSDSIIGTRQNQSRLFWTFHHEKELQLTCWPLITIGV